LEDDHDTRVAIRHCLEDVGYFVFSVTNGAAALEALEQMTIPDAILLDINMPIMNGDQFLQVISNHPKFSTIPVLQMSATTYSKRPGVLKALRKPIDLDELMGALEKCKAVNPPCIESVLLSSSPSIA
jgi:CheY-like chemotaxis protein